jgi:3-methyladenine DNA glycosylase AlkD
MSIVADAKGIIQQFEHSNANLTAIRTMANEIGKNRELADYLWMHGGTKSRLLALLILELKAVDTTYLATMITDIERAAEPDQRQLSDWLVANVIMKKSALKKEASTWLADTSTMKQRMFWSLQARTIKAENTELNRQLLEAIEQHITAAPAMVQEHMNWCAAQIGIADETLRQQCIRLGERLGLYKDYPVSKGCTSPYLPIWIESVVEARNGRS